MGRITLIAQLQSNIQSGLNAIGAAANRVGTAFAGTNRQANAAAAGVNRMNNAFVQAQMNAQKATVAVSKMTNAQDRHGMSTGRLIMMMVKFGIILKALQLVTAPLSWIDEGIKSALVLDRGLRNILGMLANVDDTSESLDRRYRRMQMDATTLMTRYGQTAEATVAGLYKIGSVVDTLNFQGVPAYVDKTSLALKTLGDIAGKGAVAGMTDLATAADALTTIMSGMNIPISQAGAASDILFQTVRVGKADFNAVQQSAGQFVGILSSIAREGHELQDLRDVMGMFGFMSTFLPTEQAGIATKNILSFFTNQSAEATSLIEQLRTMSGGSVKLRTSDVAANGYRSTFQGLADFLEPNKFRAAMSQYFGTDVSPEQATGLSMEILTTIFDDARAAKGALRMFAKDGGASLETILSKMDEFPGATDRAFGEGAKGMQFQLDKVNQEVIALARNFTSGGEAPLIGIIGALGTSIHNISNRPAFREASVPVKIGMVFESLSRDFSQWYFTGGGQTAITNVATTIGHDVGMFVMGAFGLKIKGDSNGADFKSAWYDAGKNAAGSFIRGLLDVVSPFNLLQPKNEADQGKQVPVGGGISNLWQNASALRGVSIFGLSRLVQGKNIGKMGGLAALLAGLVAQNMPEDSPISSVLGLAGLGVGGFLAGRGAFRSIFGSGMGIGPGGGMVQQGGIPGGQAVRMFLGNMGAALGSATLNKQGPLSGIMSLLRGVTPMWRLPGRGGFASISNPLKGLSNMLGNLGKFNLPLISKIPGIGGLLKRIPFLSLLFAGAEAGSNIAGGEDPLKALGRGAFQMVGGGLGAAIGGGIGGALGIPSGPGAIAAALIGGGIGGTFGWGLGENIFNSIFGGPPSNQAAAADLTGQGSVIDSYFALKNAQAGAGGSQQVIIQIDKLADTITAGTPEEAAKMADDFLEALAAKLEGVQKNSSKVMSGGGAGALLTP